MDSLNTLKAEQTFCRSRLEGQQDFTVRRCAVLATLYCSVLNNSLTSSKEASLEREKLSNLER